MLTSFNSDMKIINIYMHTKYLEIVEAGTGKNWTGKTQEI